MTRDQIKHKIRDIIMRETNDILGVDDAVEEIMKLWDQGFIYDLPKEKE